MNPVYRIAAWLILAIPLAASAQNPFNIPADTNWFRTGSAEDIRASGLVYQCADTNEPLIQIVFFNRVTPTATPQDHRAFFKDFLHNIQNAYPNVLMTYTPILNEEIPLISVFDPEGNTFFWGAVYHQTNTYEIAVTAKGRWPSLPIQVRDLLSRVTLRSDEH